MHVTGGQPARGPELLTIQHCNSAEGEHRNIFVEDEAVVFVTRYHKGYSMNDDVKVIHRYLPRPVGELLVWYLWLVLPFQQDMESIRWERKEMSYALWPKDPNGVEWKSERIRKLLQRESMIGMGTQLGIQSYRECAIAISRKYLQASRAFQADDDDEDGEFNEDEDVIDEQAGHTSHVAGMIYARAINERQGEVHSKRRKFREASEMWHRFLGFPRLEHQRQKPAPFDNEIEEARTRRRQQLRSKDIRTVLKQMMGEGKEFRGIQEEAIQAVMLGESPVVAVMPTGGGKSLLFMLPAWCGAGGTTVVVVPLIALRADLKVRCEELNIRCAEWDRLKPPDAAQIVLVTPESAIRGQFQTYLNRLRGLQQLDRIVIDEAHVILNDRMNFRKDLQQLGMLNLMATQMVLLTATLPPSCEEMLWTRMGWTADEVKMFRAATTRTNIQYRVHRVTCRKVEDEEPIIQQMIRDRVRQWPDGKIVVYANQVSKVQKLAHELECAAYFHDATAKEEMLQAFRDGDSSVIVATSALGMGIDIPNIRAVIHVDVPRTLLDYAQESGRAGRDGQKSEAVVMVSERDYRNWQDEKPKSMKNHAERELVRQYMDGKIKDQTGSRACRRVVLDGYLDQVRKSVDITGPEMDRTGYMANRRGPLSNHAREAMEVDEIDKSDQTESRIGCREGEERCDCCDQEITVSKSSREFPPKTASATVENTTEARVSSSPSPLPLTPMPKEANIPQTSIGKRRRRVESTGEEVVHTQNQQRMGLRQRYRDRQQHEAEEVEELRQILEGLRGRCPWCMLHRKLQRQHVLYRCPEKESAKSRKFYPEFRRQIRAWKSMESFSGCRWCLTPQAWCDRWEQGDEEGQMYREVAGGRCQYDEVVLSTFAVLVQDCTEYVVGLSQRMKEVVDRADRDRILRPNQRGEGEGEEGGEEEVEEDENDMEVEIQDMDNIEDQERMRMQWLGRKIMWGGIEASELLREVWRGMRETTMVKSPC